CSPCTGRGLASRRVAAVAGGLLPHRFTLTCVASGAATQAVCFLCHFPSAFAASLTGASCPAVSGLSSTGRARRGHPACTDIVASVAMVDYVVVGAGSAGCALAAR